MILGGKRHFSHEDKKDHRADCTWSSKRVLDLLLDNRHLIGNNHPSCPIGRLAHLAASALTANVTASGTLPKASRRPRWRLSERNYQPLALPSSLDRR